MSPAFNQYLGKAGHLRAMSDFLIRGWNVAIPEVDVGDDIFVVKDDQGLLRRVQVKTATARATQDGRAFAATFSLRRDQLMNQGEIPIHYVFMVWREKVWTKPIIIRQDHLLDQVTTKKLRRLKAAKLTIKLIFGKAGEVKFAKQPWHKHVEDFTDFPVIDH